MALGMLALVGCERTEGGLIRTAAALLRMAMTRSLAARRLACQICSHGQRHRVGAFTPWCFANRAQAHNGHCDDLSAMGLQPKAASCVVCSMADPDPELEHLLAAERAAFERCEEFRGYPPDEQAAALALWTAATEAVREYLSKHS
jgi:hypothetical protein